MQIVVSEFNNILFISIRARRSRDEGEDEEEAEDEGRGALCVPYRNS